MSRFPNVQSMKDKSPFKMLGGGLIPWELLPPYLWGLLPPEVLLADFSGFSNFPSQLATIPEEREDDMVVGDSPVAVTASALGTFSSSKTDSAKPESTSQTSGAPAALEIS